MLQYLRMDNIRAVIPRDLINLFESVELYIVGGFVRNFFMGIPAHSDIDLAGPESADFLLKFCNITPANPKLGTCLITIPSGKYEYTPFRTESYTGGNHTPDEVFFGAGIYEDSCRRDFSANAIYYDIRGDKFIDFHNGIADIKNKILRAAPDAATVFYADGLRLMRLCRLAAETGFEIESETLKGAIANAANLADISPERIWQELLKILNADAPYGIEGAHYRGLKLLNEVGLWKYIIPEIEEGIGCAQNSKYHAYDVFEHTMRTVLYSPPRVRLAALLHDAAKPYCQRTFGDTYQHAKIGTQTARKILTRLKCPNVVIEHTARLTEHHMFDNLCETRMSKLKIFVAENRDIIYDLVALKSADFKAKGIPLPRKGGCEAGRVVCGEFRERLTGTYEQMLRDGIPMSVKELNLGGETLVEANIPPKERGKILRELWKQVVIGNLENSEEKLLHRALFLYNQTSRSKKSNNQ